MERVKHVKRLPCLLELALVKRSAFPVGSLDAGVAREALGLEILLGLFEPGLGAVEGDDPPGLTLARGAC
jgi:hypothetical protein